MSEDLAGEREVLMSSLKAMQREGPAWLDAESWFGRQREAANLKRRILAIDAEMALERLKEIERKEGNL